MASKKQATTRWKAALWERVYRGVTMWVEEMWTTTPKWSWQTEGTEGRARTKAAAMRAAQRSVDDALTKGATGDR